MRLPKYSGVHVDGRVGLHQLRAQLLDRDEPVVRDPEDERRVAAPAEGEAVLDLAGRDELPALAQVDDDLLGGLAGAEPVQPAEVRVEAAGLVHGHHDRQVVDARELEVLGAAARRDVDDARCPPRATRPPRG